MHERTLTITFPEEFFFSLDRLHRFEDQLKQAMKPHDMDGHDIGEGEVTFFVHTDDLWDAVERMRATGGF